ncbi:hypothetical protein CHS0354_039900 [Potamilus streckersoni]|uniref:Uncharacterized protein n=1 Tax=Potamilus streckersoni TaxID=2493646 RepID=A0AAE0TGV7_9BIVA|nr:hypothetical protein CHS0354_039900 [Potamilus streckersoni]
MTQTILNTAISHLTVQITTDKEDGCLFKNVSSSEVDVLNKYARVLGLRPRPGRSLRNALCLHCTTKLAKAEKKNTINTIGLSKLNQNCSCAYLMYTRDFIDLQ